MKSATGGVSGTNLVTGANPSSNAIVISDSHAQRKAMFLKQYNNPMYNRRMSIDSAGSYGR